MTGLAPKLPRIVPIFTELKDRGLKRAHLSVYGAIVAFEREQYVPTCADIAKLAGLNDANDCRDVRRHIAYLVRAKLLRVVRYSSKEARYLPIGPRLEQMLSVPAANDNGSMPDG